MIYQVNTGRLQVGDESEFKKFYQSYFPHFLSFAYGYIRSKEVCRDIVQDIFISYWERHADFKEIAPIEAYFYRAVRNRCLNELRRTKNNFFLTLDEINELASTDNFEERIINEEVNRMIRQQIASLSPQAQKILRLSLLKKSNQEIADILSISINTVKVHKARAYTQLRKQIEKLYLILSLVKIT